MFFLEWVESGEGEQKIYCLVVLCSNLPNDLGHFSEVKLEIKTKFRKKGLSYYTVKVLTYLPI